MKDELELEFVPYEEALALRQIGFDEPCFCVYNSYVGELFMSNSNDLYNQPKNSDLSSNVSVATPLYQQAFKWFRKKHNFYAEIKVEDSVKLGGQKYYWTIFGPYKSFEGTTFIRCLKDTDEIMSSTYEEAELACLKQLIELVKTKS